MSSKEKKVGNKVQLMFILTLVTIFRDYVLY